MLLAVGLVIAMYVADDWLARKTDCSSLLSTCAGLSKTKGITGYLSSGFYIAVLGGAIGILGVFIALVAGGLSTSAGSSSGPTSLTARQLLFRDPQVRFVSRLFSFTITLSLVLLTSAWLLKRTSLLGLIAVTLLTALAVLVAAQLFRRGFYFLDPTRLVRVAGVGVLDSARLASVPGFKPWNPAFQDLYRRRASDGLEEIETLWEAELEAEHLREYELGRVAQGALSTIRDYLGMKGRIPSQSSWFERQAQYEEWFLASHTKASMALATDTLLPANLEPNQNWLEARLKPLVTRSMAESVSRGDGAAAVVLSQAIVLLVAACGEALELEAGRQWLAILDASAFGETESAEGRARPAEDKQLAIIDGAASAPIALLLGFFRRVRRLDVDRLVESIKRLRWQKANYCRLDLPSLALQEAEELQRRIDFERAAGADDTPGWYLANLVLRGVAQQVADSLATIGVLAGGFDREPRASDSDTDVMSAAIVLSRGIEYCHKFLSNMEAVQGLMEAIEKHRVLTDLPWPSIDLEALADNLKATRVQLLQRHSEFIPQLANLPQRQDRPDMFGRAVQIAGDLCFEAAIDGKSESIASLFPLYFRGTLEVFERLRRKLDVEAIAWAAAPLQDLFDLSGYMILMAELHHIPDIWGRCRATWNTYLETNELAPLQVFGGVDSIGHSVQGMLGPRALFRTQWHQRIDSILNEVPMEVVPQTFGIDKVAQHPSILIQVCATGEPMGSMFRGTDMFVELYLMRRPAAAGLFNRSTHLLDALRHRDVPATADLLMRVRDGS